MAAPPIAERHRPHFHQRAPMLEAVRAATTGNITISTALNNGDTLDGITLATGDRVLVKDQSTASQNGIYVVGATPVRAYDQSTDDPGFGFLIFVREGTTNGGTRWQNTNTAAPTIGSTSITFVAAAASTSFGTPALTFDTTNAAGAASTAIRTDAQLALFDGTSPVNQAFGDTAATGSAGKAARRDHKHGMPTAAVTTSGLTQATAKVLGRTTAGTGAIEELSAGTGITIAGGTISASGSGVTFGTPAIVLGTAAANGSIDEAIRRDSTIVAFDATAPTTQAFGDSAATGSAAVAARRDHKHGEPTAAVTTSGLTMATGKVLGRTSASTGAIEELSAGSGITISGGTISAPGGGSGGSAIYPLDNYVNAFVSGRGDDFTSATLSGGGFTWTRRGFTTETLQQGYNATWAEINTNGRTGGDGYFTPATSGDWTLAAKFIMRGSTQSWGIGVVDTNGTGVWGMAEYSAHSPWASILIAVTTYTTYGGSYVQGLVTGASPNVSNFAHDWIDSAWWVKLRKSGTSYFWAFSRDGEMWTPEGSGLTWAGTVDRWCFGFAPLGGSVAAYTEVNMDWIGQIA